MPKDLKDAAVPLLHKHGRMIPGWVKLFGVRYDDMMADAHACILSEQNYYRATLTFGPGWMNCDSEEREWVVVHELCHTMLSPVERAWEEWFATLPKKMKAVADRRFEDALEEAVSGLAHMIVGQEEGA